MQITTWYNCYPSRWQGLIAPEAMAHPAKYSSRLIAKIYRHILEEGWLKPGDTIIDPFGGVALGALDAMRLGLNWTGIELEPHFVKSGNANIDLWNTRYAGKMPRWGSARLLNGDSRNLMQVISQADASVSSPPYMDRSIPPGGIQGVDAALLRMNTGQTYSAAVSSPPYADGCAHTGGNDRPGYLEGGKLHGVGIDGLVSSPPYSSTGLGKASTYTDQQKLQDEIERARKVGGVGTLYGTTPGQLGSLPPGDYRAAISSPPFLQSQGGTNVNAAEGPLSDPCLIRRHAAGNQSANAYGESEGQIGRMPEGDYDIAVSSPPFEKSLSRDTVDASARRSLAREMGINNAEHITPIDMENIGERKQGYGSDSANVGNISGDTFWTASRLIVNQVYQALAPGAHAVWVVKGFVKNKEIVDFPGQWRELCESAGFLTLHEHRAMLVHHRATYQTIDGDLVEDKVESKSFFRRLLEKKGSPRIDWETVYCMEKPLL